MIFVLLFKKERRILISISLLILVDNDIDDSVQAEVKDSNQQFVVNLDP